MYPGLDGLYCNERKLRDDAADLLYDSLHDLTDFRAMRWDYWICFEAMVGLRWGYHGAGFEEIVDVNIRPRQDYPF